MAADSSPSAVCVTVSISRDPALVRTVRLVTAAVARRTGLDERFVEEVGLAVGEACALLLGEPADGPLRVDGRSAEPVTVALQVEDVLQADVAATVAVPLCDPLDSDIDGAESWTLLRALVDDFRLIQDGRTTRISMSWPVP